MPTTPPLNLPAVQDALEDQRQAASEDVARIASGVKADSRGEPEEIEKLIQASHTAGVLDAICAEYDITETVMTRRLS